MCARVLGWGARFTNSSRVSHLQSRPADGGRVREHCDRNGHRPQEKHRPKNREDPPDYHEPLRVAQDEREHHLASELHNTVGERVFVDVVCVVPQPDS